jgi:hypothetical protein
MKHFTPDQLRFAFMIGGVLFFLAILRLPFP